MLTAGQQKTVEDNMPLVWYVLKKYFPKHCTNEDVFQIGCLGLCRAAAKFDPERGVAFSTYAAVCIISEIRHYFRESHRHVWRFETESTDDLESGYYQLPAVLDTENEALANCNLEKVLHNLPFNVRKTAICRMAGLTQCETAAKLGVSQAQISRLLKRVKTKLKEESEVNLSATNERGANAVRHSKVFKTRAG
ncbi:RNA polymerase sigma factor (sigma-70 family) [Hydrogenispora ethanolica]|uniref:RNA polymerase sigma factor (Sigma-70 family) n=1 Tax=Hydrogenispora ethanolica TaxID=1082276 RepID=A0A4R1RIF6_HYDET|nr:sigma-70 family RNA polymerase sigma factor [Hydrogenispora ethanolica]TCL65878.1 RNA polymerase sigma factor (sigma-70 family) [Hydrogenispora ethanolica]